MSQETREWRSRLSPSLMVDDLITRWAERDARYRFRTALTFQEEAIVRQTRLEEASDLPDRQLEIARSVLAAWNPPR